MRPGTDRFRGRSGRLTGKKSGAATFFVTRAHSGIQSRCAASRSSTSDQIWSRSSSARYADPSSPRDRGARGLGDERLDSHSWTLMLVRIKAVSAAARRRYRSAGYRRNRRGRALPPHSFRQRGDAAIVPEVAVDDRRFAGPDRIHDRGGIFTALRDFQIVSASLKAAACPFQRSICSTQRFGYSSSECRISHQIGAPVLDEVGRVLGECSELS